MGCFTTFTHMMATRRMILFVIFYEFFQKFATLGFSSVLFLFLKHEMDYTWYNAIGIYHMYVGMSYLLPVFGTISADLHMNKVLAILLISIFAVIGQAIVVMCSIAYTGDNNHSIPFVMDNIGVFVGIGLLLRAIGGGSSRELVSSIDEGHFDTGDAAVDERFRNTVHRFVHYGIVAAMIVAFTLPPALRMNVSCFGEMYCYPLALGVSGIGMILAIITLMAGYRVLKVLHPGDSVIVDFFGVIWASMCNCCGGGAHWVDNASYAFTDEFLDDVKLALHVMPLFLPLPIFWALYEQMASRWVMTATKLGATVDVERRLYMEPEMMMVLNPLLLLLLLPLGGYVIHPLWSKTRFCMTTVKQRMFFGGVMAIGAFLCGGYVEYLTEEWQQSKPPDGIADLTLINNFAHPIEFTLTMLKGSKETLVHIVDPNDWLWLKLPAKGVVPYNVTVYIIDELCSKYTKGLDPAVTDALVEKRLTAVSYNPYGTSPRGQVKPCWTPEWPFTHLMFSEPCTCELQLPRIAIAHYNRRIRGLPTTNDDHFWNNTYFMYDKSYYSVRIQRFLDPNFEHYDFFHVRAGVYNIRVNEIDNECRFSRGGVYIIIWQVEWYPKCKTIYKTDYGNSTVFYQTPQYLLITAGQYLYPITLLEYSITQIPYNMKPLIWNTWLISIAFGNFLVAILSFPDLFARQVWYYVLYAGLMLVDCLLLFILLFNYIPYHANDGSGSESGSGMSSSRSGSSFTASRRSSDGSDRRVRFRESIDSTY